MRGNYEEGSLRLTGTDGGEGGGRGGDRGSEDGPEVTAVVAQRKGRQANPHRKKRRAWLFVSSSGSPRGPSTVAQTAAGGRKRGPVEDGRRQVEDRRGSRPDSSSPGTPATLASSPIQIEFTCLLHFLGTLLTAFIGIW
jgi:hypothetical protein